MDSKGETIRHGDCVAIHSRSFSKGNVTIGHVIRMEPCGSEIYVVIRPQDNEVKKRGLVEAMWHSVITWIVGDTIRVRDCDVTVFRDIRKHTKSTASALPAPSQVGTAAVPRVVEHESIRLEFVRFDNDDLRPDSLVVWVRPDAGPVEGILKWTGYAGSNDKLQAYIEVDGPTSEAQTGLADNLAKRFGFKPGVLVDCAQILNMADPGTRSPDSDACVKACDVALNSTVVRMSDGLLGTVVKVKQIGTCGNSTQSDSFCILFEESPHQNTPDEQRSTPSEAERILIVETAELLDSGKYQIYPFDSEKHETPGNVPQIVFPLEQESESEPGRGEDLKLERAQEALVASPICIPLVSKGIQGFKNSCYIDATFYAMFAYLQAFDQLFLERRTSSTAELYEQSRQVLRHKIVTPLRQTGFVPSNNVLMLRQLLSELDQNLLAGYGDVEHFLYFLCEDVFQLEGFISYDTGTRDFVHSICVDLDAGAGKFLKIGALVNASFEFLQVRLRERPSPAFLIQMPYDNGKLMAGLKVLPTLALNLADITTGQSMEPEMTLILWGVICLHSNHFTCFVKCNSYTSTWVYFDSNPTMGEPTIVVLPKLEEYLLAFERAWEHGAMEIGRAVFQVEDENIDTYRELMEHWISNNYLCVYL